MNETSPLQLSRVLTPTQSRLSFCDATPRDLKRWIANLPKANIGETARQLKAIAHEPTTKTGLSHTDGVISMGRWAPGTAQSARWCSSIWQVAWPQNARATGCHTPPSTMSWTPRSTAR